VSAAAAAGTPEPRVALYVAPGCHLCEAALEVLGRLRSDVPFALEIVDIEGDLELERRYRIDIPVVEIDGERALRYFVDEDELRALLRR
jgi:glutaredoxin